MAQHQESRPIDGAVELLKANGFDGLAEADEARSRQALQEKRLLRHRWKR